MPLRLTDCFGCPNDYSLHLRTVTLPPRLIKWFSPATPLFSPSLSLAGIGSFFGAITAGSIWWWRRKGLLPPASFLADLRLLLARWTENKVMAGGEKATSHNQQWMVKTILVLCVTKLVGSYSNPRGLLPPQDATTRRKGLRRSPFGDSMFAAVASNHSGIPDVGS